MWASTIPTNTREDLQIVQAEWWIQHISYFLWDKLWLAPSEIQKCFKVMMWDIYDELSAASQKMAIKVFNDFQDKWDIAGWLLEAIAIINIEHHMLNWGTLDVWDAESGMDLMLSLQWIEFSLYEKLFHQVNEYRNTGKLNPPALETIWTIESVRERWADAVKRLLEEQC